MTKIRALIVDDEMPARNELKYILHHNPSVATVGEFTNGKMVLEYLQAHPDATDIVFLDIRMPVLNGLEVMEKIKAFQNSDISFISGLINK